MSRNQNQHRVPTPILAGPGSGDGGSYTPPPSMPAPVLSLDLGDGGVSWTFDNSNGTPDAWWIESSLTGETSGWMLVTTQDPGDPWNTACSPGIYYRVSGGSADESVRTTPISNVIQYPPTPPPDELVATAPGADGDDVDWTWSGMEPTIWMMVMCTAEGVALTGTEESCIPWLGAQRTTGGGNRFAGGYYFLVGVASNSWHPGGAELTPRSNIFGIGQS